jgi:hypothetical protein
MALRKRSVMTDRHNACATRTAHRQPVLENTQPVRIKIPAGLIQQQNRRREGFQTGNGNHSALRGMQIQWVCVGNVF